MYRTIDASFWTDPDIRALSGTERYLFLYLVTNPHAHVSGMYYLPKVMIEHETGLKGKALGRGIDTLSKGYLAWYDPKNEVIFVRSMFRYQGRGEKNNQAAANQLKNLHKSPLINKFLKYYPEIQERLGKGYRYPIEGVSEFGTPDQDQDQEQEQEQEEEKMASSPNGPPPDPLAPVLTIPTNRQGEEFLVSQEMLDRYRETYPAVDVLQEIKQLRSWSIDNPTRRKTYRGMSGFLNRNLGRAQDRGGGARASPPPRSREQHLAEIKADVAMVEAEKAERQGGATRDK